MEKLGIGRILFEERGFFDSLYSSVKHFGPPILKEDSRTEPLRGIIL